MHGAETRKAEEEGREREVVTARRAEEEKMGGARDEEGIDVERGEEEERVGPSSLSLLFTHEHLQTLANLWPPDRVRMGMAVCSFLSSALRSAPLVFLSVRKTLAPLSAADCLLKHAGGVGKKRGRFGRGGERRGLKEFGCLRGSVGGEGKGMG
eukprot:561098-Hanusia_phi.AAC.1